MNQNAWNCFPTLFLATLFAILIPDAVANAQIGSSNSEADVESVDYDVRIKDLLDETDLKYEIDEDGDFKLLFEYEDGRSQIVFINSNTETYREMEIREVWSLGFVSENKNEDDDEVTKVSDKIAANLIRANAQAKLGAWQVQTMGGREIAVFRAMIAANSSANVVIETLRLVGSMADEKELELGKSDEL